MEAIAFKSTARMRVAKPGGTGRRRTRWLVAAMLVTPLLGLLGRSWISSEPRSRFRPPTENPGLAVRFAGFTNFNHRWLAEMLVTNQTGHLHFVEAWGSIPKYGGKAITSTATDELHGIGFSGGPANIPPHGVLGFDVELPVQTESWEVSVACYRSDTSSRFLLSHGQWFDNWPEWLVAPLAKFFIQPTWDRDFEVNSGILTNRPPEP